MSLRVGEDILFSEEKARAYPLTRIQSRFIDLFIDLNEHLERFNNYLERITNPKIRTHKDRKQNPLEFSNALMFISHYIIELEKIVPQFLYRLNMVQQELEVAKFPQEIVEYFTEMKELGRKSAEFLEFLEGLPKYKGELTREVFDKYL